MSPKRAKGTRRSDRTLIGNTPILGPSILVQAGPSFQRTPGPENPSLGVRLCKRMKIRDIIAKLKEDGWYQVAQKGSHRQFKHPLKKGRVTIAGHRNDDLALGR
jgi:predicted RNA binding protein YcfA (HicA-like mRNA interferase family)